MVTRGMMASRFKLILVGAFVFISLAVSANASQKDVPPKVADTASIVQININTATIEQLSTLPGVGPALAERIISHRTAVGKFNAPVDLIAVKGVGQKKLDKMIDLIVVE